MAGKRECPSCRTVYAGDEKLFCPKDGTRLLDVQPPRPPEDPFVGRVIAGRFVLERRLGKGGMGVVYLAKHNVLNRKFAVKLLRRENVSNERALARFFREARIASSVDHPNIVSIYDYGQTDKGEPYLAMEYVEGTVLYQRVQKSRNHKLSPACAVHILVQVARALAHAHERGVVHRDIKPENILLTTFNGQSDFVKVLDFGVARIVGQPPLTRIGEEIIGTPEFLAPEMMVSAEVAPPVDLYSLGIMLHDTIVGEPPFRGDIREILQGHVNRVPPRLSERRGDVEIPPALDRLAAALLEKDPAKRPSAFETVQRLEQIQSLLPPCAFQAALLDGPAQDRADALSSATASVAVLPEGGHAAKTLILDQARRGEEGLQGAATMVLPASVAPLQVMASADPAKRAEIEALESELDIANLRFADEVDRLCREVFVAGWPMPARELRRYIRECQEAESQHNLQLSRLKEQAQQQLQRLDEQRQALRQRILSLSERLQLTPGLGPTERQQLINSIEESERSLAAVLQVSSSSIEPEMLRLRREIRELQIDRFRGWNELARLVLEAAPAGEAFQAARRTIAQLQQQSDSAKAMLTLLNRGK